MAKREVVSLVPSSAWLPAECLPLGSTGEARERIIAHRVADSISGFQPKARRVVSAAYVLEAVGEEAKRVFGCVDQTSDDPGVVEDVQAVRQGLFRGFVLTVVVGVDGGRAAGVKPEHILWQVLLQDRPHSQDVVVLESWNRLAIVCQRGVFMQNRTVGVCEPVSRVITGRAAFFHLYENTRFVALTNGRCSSHNGHVLDRDSWARRSRYIQPGLIGLIGAGVAIRHSGLYPGTRVGSCSDPAHP